MIDPAHVSEQYLVNYASEHKWRYLKDQMPNEVWILLQTDSNGSTGILCPPHHVLDTTLTVRFDKQDFPIPLFPIPARMKPTL